MKKVTKYTGKNVLVVGLGKSGLNAAYLLRELGANVTINDKNTPKNQEILENLAQAQIKTVFGSHPLALLKGTDLVVKNPGIP